MKALHVLYFSLGQIMLLVIALAVLSRGQRERLDEIKGEMLKTLETARINDQRYAHVTERLELLNPIKIEQAAVRSDIRDLNTKLGSLSPVITITNQIPPTAYAEQANLLLPFPDHGDLPEDSPQQPEPTTKQRK